MSDILRAAVSELRTRRDALTTLIDSLELAFGPLLPLTPAPAPVAAPPPKAREKRVNPKQRAVFKAAGVDAVVAARDQAVLKALSNHPALRSDEIIARMPKESGLTPEQAKAAFRNTMTRLRAKGQIGRTGDVWSLSGAGMDHANG